MCFTIMSQKSIGLKKSRPFLIYGKSKTSQKAHECMQSQYFRTAPRKCYCAHCALRKINFCHYTWTFCTKKQSTMSLLVTWIANGLKWLRATYGGRMGNDTVNWILSMWGEDIVYRFQVLWSYFSISCLFVLQLHSIFWAVKL